MALIHKVIKPFKSAMTATCLGWLLLCFYFLPFRASAAETASSQGNSSANAQQFEQWLRKNGYGAVQESRPSPSLEQGPVLAAATPTALPQSVAPTGGTLPPPPLASKPPSQAVGAATADAPPSPEPPPTLADSQQAMLNSLPPPATLPDETTQKAFNMLLQQNMPLNTEQVVQMHQQIDLAQRAAAVPANVPPKPVSTTIMINLAPGSTPPAIRLAQGYVSSLVFVDSTGAPWPIAAYEIGNPKATNIQWDGKSNILLLQAVSPYSDGNLVIRLASLPTPITLQLVSGQRVVDFRADLHVSGVGPNAKELPVGVNLPGNANNMLLNILDGVAPAGSKLLSVKGGDCQAWIVGDKMYLRTRFTILSPGWIGKMTSSDGMQAYELPRSASILISRYGEPVELKVEGF